MLLGNSGQKGSCGPAAQHLCTDTTQTRPESEEAGKQDKDVWWKRDFTSAKCSLASSDQTGVDDAQGHGALF